MRKFEIPYNFDKNLINGLQILNTPNESIECIYTSPYYYDYKAIIRNPNEKDWLDMTKTEYANHIIFINDLYPNKVQLLLQNTENKPIMNLNQLKFYFDLGINNFCVGSIRQAQLIKEFKPDAKIICSITAHTNKDNVKSRSELFDAFVLDFSFCRDIDKIQNLPDEYKYILLVNSQCHHKCDGTHHWEFRYNNIFYCPGKYPQISYEDSCILRPMDLPLFDNKIYAYKLQDRGWPTHIILRDMVLYTTNFSMYPGINSNQDIYKAVSS